MPQNISRKGYALLEIIQWNEKDVWFPTGFQEEPNHKGPLGGRMSHNSIIYAEGTEAPYPRFGEYYIEIELTGRIGDFELEPEIYSVLVNVIGIDDVRIKNVRRV